MKRLFCSINCFLYCHTQLLKGIPKYFYMFSFIAVVHLASHHQFKMHSQGLLS